MAEIDLQKIREFANTRIATFHNERLARLGELKLDEVLKHKNPYLFKAKNMESAGALVESIMDAFLSSSEEKIFGDFLEALAVYVSKMAFDGRKTTGRCIDLEVERDNTLYIVSIKSGPNWGNASQYKALKDDLKKAVVIQKQSHSGMIIQPVLGICYGKTRRTDNGDFVKITGQDFWYFISGNTRLYLDIVEPIGSEAKKNTEEFQIKRAGLVTLFTVEFASKYCNEDGTINWEKLVKFNSGNLEPKEPPKPRKPKS